MFNLGLNQCMLGKPGDNDFGANFYNVNERKDVNSCIQIDACKSDILPVVQLSGVMFKGMIYTVAFFAHYRAWMISWYQTECTDDECMLIQVVKDKLFGIMDS